MNIEYTQVSDFEFKVTDENGNVTTRTDKSGNFNQKLVLENQLEYINGVIKEIEKLRDEDIPFEKGAYFNSLEFPLIVSFGCATVGSLYNHDDLALVGMGLGVVGCGLALLCTGVRNIYHLNSEKKRKEALDLVLEKAHSLAYKVMDDINCLEPKSTEKIKYNKPIIVNDDPNFIIDTNFALNQTYYLNVGPKLRRHFPLK